MNTTQRAAAMCEAKGSPADGPPTSRDITSRTGGSTVALAGGMDAVAVQRTAKTFNVTLPTIAGLRCLGENILIKRIEDPLAGQGGSRIIIPDAAKDAGTERSPWAVVVMVGPGGRVVTPQPVEDDRATPHGTVQSIRPGDLLLIKSFGGTEFRLGGHSLIFVKPEHVLAVFSRSEST